MVRVTSSDASSGSFLCARTFRELAEVTSLRVTNCSAQLPYADTFMRIGAHP
jgi:hypothetical protein